MMNPRDRAIFDEFCHKVRERFPDARIYAYGSRVRGDYDRESDLDICVIVDELNDASRAFISDLAWEIGFANDLLIQSVLFTSTDFDIGPWSVSPIVRAIKKDGLAA